MYNVKIFLYKDDQGRLRRTKSGHYRFDLRFEDQKGVPFFSIRGLRVDYKQRQILPVTVPQPNGHGVYIVGEVAPQSYEFLVGEVCFRIQSALADEGVDLAS